MSAESVVITGASSGIGRELAKCFAADGSRLVLIARHRHALQSLADDLRMSHKTHSEVLPADLAEPGAPSRIFEHLRSNGTRVDVLVNNAGFGANGEFTELSLERQLQMVQVNVMALMHLTGLFLPAMLTRGRGGVLNVASTAALQAGPGMAVYYATKAFVLSFTEALTEEVAGKGVVVSSLCPGPTHTNFAEAAGARNSRLFTAAAMSAEEVARIGHRAFRRGKAIELPGLRNKLLAFSVRLAPRAVARRIAGFLNRGNHR